MSSAFTRLADTLVDEYDVIDLLDRLVGYSVDLLAVEAAGIVLGDVRGDLRVVAASNDDAELMELLQLQNDEGPCLECYHTAAAGQRARTWPRSSTGGRASPPRSTASGVPFGARPAVAAAAESIGASTCSTAARARCPRPTCPWDRPWPTWPRSGSCRNARSAAARWSTSSCRPRLNSRVVIEQAKGVLAQHGTVAMDVAFDLLRRHSRRTNQLLSRVARRIVERELDPDAVLET